MMKHLYPDGSGLFQGDNAPIHRARGVTEWFEEYEDDVNHTLEILDRHVRQRSL